MCRVTAEGSIYTFLQALSQSVSRADEAVLVITLPESDMELGGEAGQKALARLEHIFGRIEAVWEPLEVSEAFAVVRRRLFGALENAGERDRTCEAFSACTDRAAANIHPASAKPGICNG